MGSIIQSPAQKATLEHDQWSLPLDSDGAIGIVHIANALAHKHPVRPPLGSDLPHQEIDSEYVEALELTGQIPAWEALAAEAASELRGVPSGVR